MRNKNVRTKKKPSGISRLGASKNKPRVGVPPLPLYPGALAKRLSEISDVLAGKSRWAVIKGDCSKILAALGDGSVSHVITDPPYDEKTHSNARRSEPASDWHVRPGKKRGSAAIKIDFRHLTNYAFTTELIRVARRWVLAFCALEQLGDYRVATGKRWVRAGVWDRPDGAPQLSGDRPAQGAEGIAIMHAAGRKSWSAGGKRALWRCGVERSELDENGKRPHPTQKPLRLMMELIEDFTDEGDIILDPFCGSGTTGVAALRLGRRFIGCDLSAAYVKIARDRMKAEEHMVSLQDYRSAQIPLFAANQ